MLSTELSKAAGSSRMALTTSGAAASTCTSLASVSKYEVTCAALAARCAISASRDCDSSAARPDFSDSRPTITEVTATGMMARNSVPISSFCRMDWAPNELRRAMVSAHELIEELRVVEFEPRIVAREVGSNDGGRRPFGQCGRKDPGVRCKDHAAWQAVDDDAGGVVAVAHHQQHALLAWHVFGLEQRREVEQRHDAAVEIHQPEQVVRHA